MSEYKKVIETDDAESLDQFTEELFRWSQKGALPALASRELRYVLERRKDRLKRFGLTLEEQIAHTQDEIRGTLTKKGPSIQADTVYREAVCHTLYRKEGKKIYERKDPITFYATRLDKYGYTDRQCTCPNCGRSAMVSQMREGCPSCGTVFEIEDAWPVYSSYYSVPGIVERSRFVPNLKKAMITIFVSVSIIMTLLSWFVYKDDPMIVRILESLFLGVFSGGGFTFCSYMIYSIFLMMRMFGEAGRSLPLLKGLKTQKKMEKAMKEYEPDFSYPYFEGRLISLFRAIAFCEEREKLSIYEGDQDLSFLDPLVDIQYRGATQLLKFREEDGVLKVKVKVFMNDLRYDGKLRRRDENYVISMERDTDTGRDPGFNLTKVNCRNCGASFDALHQKNCPYCGTKYRLAYDDWMITSIEKA